MSKILIIASIFPNNQEPTKGMFVKQEIIGLRESAELNVIAPVPWFLPVKWFKKWYLYSQVIEKEMIGEIEVYHPKYIVIPKIARFLYGILFFLSIFKISKTIFKKDKFDIVVAYYAYPDGFAAALLAKFLKVPLVIKVLGSDINVFISDPIRRYMTVYALNTASCVVSVSNAMKNKLLKLGIKENKIVVIPNGVDTQKFKPMDKAICKKKLGIPMKKRVILYTGNIVEVKGVEYLIEAFAKIRNSDLFLILVGDGDMKLKLEYKVNELSINSNVKFMGIKPYDEIPIWMNACDVFCLPSTNEGCPNVILEALACGKSIVATNIGGIPEITESKCNVMLVPPSDVDGLSNGLRIMLEKTKDQKVPFLINKKRSWFDVADDMMKAINCIHNK